MKQDVSTGSEICLFTLQNKKTMLTCENKSNVENKYIYSSPATPLSTVETLEEGLMECMPNSMGHIKAQHIPLH